MNKSVIFIFGNSTYANVRASTMFSLNICKVHETIWMIPFLNEEGNPTEGQGYYAVIQSFSFIYLLESTPYNLLEQFPQGTHHRPGTGVEIILPNPVFFLLESQLPVFTKLVHTMLRFFYVFENMSTL